MYRLVFLSYYRWDKHTYCVRFCKMRSWNFHKCIRFLIDKLQRKGLSVALGSFPEQSGLSSFSPKHAKEANNSHQIYTRGCWLDPTTSRAWPSHGFVTLPLPVIGPVLLPVKQPQVQHWPSVIKPTRRWICKQLLLFLLHTVLFCKQQLFRRKLCDYFHTEAQKAAWGFGLLNSRLHGYFNLIK